MLKWVHQIADRVDAVAKNDPEYRELDRQRKALDGAYTELLDRLGEEDRELFLEYMNLVVDMQYRKTQLAWLYGTCHPNE